MARLPSPGGDQNQWGDILNNFLLISHNADGSFKPNSVTVSHLRNDSVTLAKLSADLRQQIEAAGSGDGTGTGQDGADGRQVEFNTSPTHIQWRYVGDSTWTNLTALADITGPQGDAGADGAQGPQGDPGTNGQGVPTGGSTGQVLAKTSGANYDTTWVNAGSGGGSTATDLATTASATSVTVTSSSGDDATIASATDSAAGVMNAADKAKLNGIDPGATANATNAQLRDRATHTGTQAVSTVTGLQAALDGKASTSALTAKIDKTASVVGFGAGTELPASAPDGTVFFLYEEG